MVSSQRLKSINIHEVGYMARNEKESISAHHNCLFFTPGNDMIQDFQRNPEQSLEGFDISAIKACISNHQKRKCCFCHKPGAVSTCANMKCKKTGLYHFPCGLRNGSVQEDVKTFCFKCADKKKTDAKVRGRRKSVSKEKAARKRASRVITTFRRVSKDKLTGEHIWAATSDSDSSQSFSQSSQGEDDLVDSIETENAGAEAGEIFDNWLNFRLRPIDWLEILEPGLPRASQENYKIYIDNAEEDEDHPADLRLEEPDDGPVIQPTEDLSTSIDLKDEFPAETVESETGKDSGHASRDEGNITGLYLSIVHRCSILSAA